MSEAPTAYQGRIGILGAGALGALYGARLLAAGFDVHFLMRSEYDHVRQHGLCVQSYEGDFTVAPPVYATPAALGRCDLALIGLKTTDNAALPALLGPIAGPRTLVLTLQNGLGNEEAIAAVLDRLQPDAAPAIDRIVGGTAFLCSTRIAPGVIHHSAHGHIHLAEAAGPARARTHALAAMFLRAGIRCAVYDSLAEIRWRKLIWNVPFNGLGVAAGRCDTAQVLADPELCAVARGLMDEVIAGARADGVTLEPSQAGQMMDNTASMGPYRSSMQVDAEAGRPLEVESILGEPLRRARAAGIATPRLEFLYGLVRRHDRLTRQGPPDGANEPS